MDEDAGTMSDRLRSTREELGGRIRQLGNQARNVPWRSYYERNPWLFVGAAFAGGLLLSTAIPRRRPGRGPDVRRLKGAVETAASDTKEIWDRVKATLLAAAGSQISTFVRETLPGLLSSSRSTRQAEASDERSQKSAGGGGGNGHAKGQAAYQ